jgi:hypothetical protein
MRARGGTDYGAEDARIFIQEVLPKAPHIPSSLLISAARGRAIPTNPTP